MRPSRQALALLALAALPATAQELSDLHLNAAPRTEREARRVAMVVTPPDDPTQPQRFELRSGGAGTVRVRDGDEALSQPAANLTTEQRMTFELGDALFERLWVSAPSSTIASDGLGPLYNARSCEGCHRLDGRGGPPSEDGGTDAGLVLRLSLPARPGTPGPEGIAEWIATVPDPVYGAQLQDAAIQGQLVEGRIAVAWNESEVALSGGETASLRRPAWRAEDLGFGPLAPGVLLSPRVAPPLSGLGLIEAIPAADILAGADPDDADGDGISGRAAIVWSHEFGAPMLGRFGHKAGSATLREQVAAAFHVDMGLSTTLFPEGWGDCTEPQAAPSAYIGDVPVYVSLAGELAALAGDDVAGELTRRLTGS